jgi:hypothetical protein
MKKINFIIIIYFFIIYSYNYTIPDCGFTRCEDPNVRDSSKYSSKPNKIIKLNFVAFDYLSEGALNENIEKVTKYLNSTFEPAGFNFRVHIFFFK